MCGSYCQPKGIQRMVSPVKREIMSLNPKLQNGVCNDLNPERITVTAVSLKNVIIIKNKHFSETTQ